MRSIAILVILIVCINMVACESIFNGSDESIVPNWYPRQLSIEQKQIDEFNAVWADFAKTYDLTTDDTKIDSIGGHLAKAYPDNGKVQIFRVDSINNSIEAAREGILAFFDRWYRLVSSQPFEIGTLDIREYDHSFGVEFSQFSKYPYTLCYKGLLGEVGLRIDKSGYLDYVRSSLVPQLKVPDKAILSEIEAVVILIDHPYYESSWTGESKKILSIRDLSESEIVIFISNNYVNGIEENLEYHLAWKFTNFDGDFYVDSQTGEILAFIQSWRS